MNTAQANLLDAAAAHLRARDLAVTIKEPRRDERIDAWLRVTKDKKHVDYAVEIKRQVTAQTVGAVVAQLKHRGELTKKPPLLVTAHVAPPVADRLTAANQQFVDAAGNAYLNAPGMFVLITGRKPEKGADKIAEKAGDVFTKPGVKTLFALICNPELATATYRQIAATANVALGALPGVLAGLQQAGHLHVMGTKRKLVATKRLLDEWALAYARRLRPKQLLRTLVTPAFGTWREWGSAGGSSKVGRRACCGIADELSRARCADSLRSEGAGAACRRASHDDRSTERRAQSRRDPHAVLGRSSRQQTACGPRAGSPRVCRPAGDRRCALYRSSSDDLRGTPCTTFHSDVN